ncbi:LptM family lipoprotein [Fodinibius sediminis]|uniref:Uncharacterized protein n=1 Tax=Fodinibius sediminis TaxID=1214077 RepID=A0A521F4U2_9BACT|nr:hypothetical protein [Fodinibius sediminis]SMO91179.1 hypothetical protein SAMN06265218_12330 [Fodinibius sediminis]
MKRISYALLIAVLVVGLAGCGDDSSSTGPDVKEDPPQIPDLTEVAQPDISFFEENNPQGQKGKQILEDEYSNFTTARFKAIFGTFFASFGQVYMGFLNPAYDNSPEFNDGEWEWSYNYSAEGQSMSMTFTAQDLGTSTEWAMYISYSDGQGNGYEDYKVMQGSTTDDGAQGSWTFNTLDEENSTETPAAKTEWNAASDTERTINTEIYDNGALDTTFDYEQNGVEHTMTFEEAGSADIDVVFWNTDTQTGYVIEDGSKMCWDANFQNVACS